MTHICVGKLTIVASNNGLSPGRRKAIIWTSAIILLIGPLGTNLSEILIEIYIFSFRKCISKCRQEIGGDAACFKFWHTNNSMSKHIVVAVYIYWYKRNTIHWRNNNIMNTMCQIRLSHTPLYTLNFTLHCCVKEHQSANSKRSMTKNVHEHKWAWKLTHFATQISVFQWLDRVTLPPLSFMFGECQYACIMNFFNPVFTKKTT